VFEGYSCTGAPIATLSRGKIAWANGELRAEKGDGHYVERPPFSPVHVANSTWKQQSQRPCGGRMCMVPKNCSGGRIPCSRVDNSTPRGESTYADEVHVLQEPVETGDTQDSELDVTRTA
jgi:hypothetical protein